MAFVIREILRRTGQDEILAFIQDVEHASGQNYIIGIRNEVYDFEASARKVVRFWPENPNAAVYHTNHPLVNGDVKPWYAAQDPSRPASPPPAPDNSRIRLQAVERRIAADGAIDTDLIKDALRSRDDEDNPVCRTRRDDKPSFTFASVVMTLSDDPRLEVVAGPPDEGEYALFDFRR